MPKLVKEWLLADAELSGGAQVEAADAPLGQRLTTADDLFGLSLADLRSGIAWDPDGLHVWVTARAANAVRKVRLSDMTTVLSFSGNATDGGARSIVQPEGLTRRGTMIWFACAGTGVYLGRIDTSTGVCRLYSQSAIAAPTHVVSADTDGSKCWARTGATGNGTYTEYTVAGTGDAAAATVTGRTQATMYDAVADNAGAFMFFTSGVVITRLNLSDSTTTTLVSLGASATLPGYSPIWRGLVWDRELDQLVVWNNNPNDWLRVNAAFTAMDARAFGFSELGGPLMLSSSTSYHRTAVAWNDANDKIAFLVPANTGVAANLNSIRVVNIGVQRTRFKWTPAIAGRLERFSVPGDLANTSGKISDLPSSPAFLAAHIDHRKTKLFYSLDGGARTEYFGKKLAVAITASTEIWLDVDFQLGVYKDFDARPWVADDDAKGPWAVVDYDDTGSTTFVPTPTGWLEGEIIGAGELEGEIWEN